MTSRVLAVLAAITIALGLPAGTRLPGGEPERHFATSVATPAPPAPAQRPVDFIPTGIAIPHLGISADVIPVGITEDAEMQVPEDIRDVGWYYPTASRSAGHGTTVLVGHRDGTANPNGVFRNISTLRAGRKIEVSDGMGRSHTYRVESVDSVPDEEFTRLAPVLFLTNGPPRLVLLTCGGVYVRGEGGYQSTVIVIATPA